MPFLITLFARLGLSQSVSRILGFVVPIALVVLLTAAVALWFHHHDKQVIANHDAVQAAQVNKTELEAERTAEANDQARQVTRQAQSQELNDARDEAIRSNPDETSKSAGPATRAVLGELRRQQAGNQHTAAK